MNYYQLIDNLQISSTYIKSSKIQLSKMIKSRGFLGILPLGLTAAASAADAGIPKKILGSGTTTLVISNYEMEGIIKIVKSLEVSDLLLRGVSETIQNKIKEKKEDFLVCY